ncbi:MAG: complement resistance protein TraT [Arcobacteraceae bacterium]|jgi:hypothetical protein|nr:complement resistance protein TraT [Arcobacteraceae bacterium]
MKKYYNFGVLIISSLIIMGVFSGCGALHTAIKKKDLDVQTKMSDSIFLEPVAPDKQIVYVRVRNTTDKEINIEEEVKQIFENNRFRVTTNPEEAEFMVQANMLQIGKSDLTSATRALESGFGGVVAGIGVAAASGASGKGYAAGGLIGGLVASVADALVDDTFYTMITDVEIRQRPSFGESIEQNQIANAQQGNSSTINQNIQNTNSQWKIYRTRIVSTANKVNLKFEEAEPELIKGLTRSLTGVL